MKERGKGGDRVRELERKHAIYNFWGETCLLPNSQQNFF